MLLKLILNGLDISCYHKKGPFHLCIKSSIVIPLQKGGDIINIIETIWKIVKKRVWSYITSFNLITPRQCGFQASNDSHEAIFDLLDSIYDNSNNRDAVVAVFCDISKAFWLYRSTYIVEWDWTIWFYIININWFQILS